MPLFDDVTVVIRAGGERTSVACWQLLAPGFAVDALAEIRDQPRAQALRRAFELALDSRRPWLLVVDAGVLVREDPLAGFLELARERGRSVFAHTGWVLDKVCAGPRPGGVYLLRTSTLPAATGFLAEAELAGCAEAPEWFLMRRMAAHGYPWCQEETLLGLCDYDQFLRDLYRRGFGMARTSPESVRLLEPFWRRASGTDPDYAALGLGLRAWRSASAGGASPELPPASIGPALREAGLKEKGRLAPGSWTGGRVARESEAGEPPGEYVRWAAQADWQRGLSEVPGGLRWLQARVRIALRRKSEL